MLQPELKFRRDKIRSLMVSQGIDAALITCNANLIYTYGCVVSGYLYLPLHSPALLFFKRPNNITGEHSFSIRKPEQIVDLLKEQGLPMPTKLMLEGDELPYTEYCRLAGLFPEAEVVNGTPLIRQARSVKTPVEIEMFRRSGIAHAKAYEQIPGVYRPGMTDKELCARLQLSRRTLQDYRNNGVIPYIQLGGKILYRESDIQKILMANYREAYRMKGV